MKRPCLAPVLLAILCATHTARAQEPSMDEEAYRALRFRGGIALAGAGVLSAIMGAAFGGRAATDKSALAGHCDARARCDLQGYTLGTEARDFSLLSTITLTIGAAAATAGTILIVTGRPHEPARSAWISPGPRGVVAGFTW